MLIAKKIGWRTNLWRTLKEINKRELFYARGLTNPLLARKLLLPATIGDLLIFPLILLIMNLLFRVERKKYILKGYDALSKRIIWEGFE